MPSNTVVEVVSACYEGNETRPQNKVGISAYLGNYQVGMKIFTGYLKEKCKLPSPLPSVLSSVILRF